MKPPKKKLPDISLGPIPAALIQSCLGIEVEHGEVILPHSGQVHAKRQHPSDYDVLLPHLKQIISDPLYGGEHPRHADKIELYGRVFAINSYAMVAISLEKAERGGYRVSSFFCVKNEDVQSRKEKGRIVTMTKK